jgi:hypothetical protein
MRPARPCKHAIQNRFTAGNVKGAWPPRVGPGRRPARRTPPPSGTTPRSRAPCSPWRPDARWGSVEDARSVRRGQRGSAWSGIAGKLGRETPMLPGRMLQTPNATQRSHKISRGRSRSSAKPTGLAQILAHRQATNRDFSSAFWANFARYGPTLCGLRSRCGPAPRRQGTCSPRPPPASQRPHHKREHTVYCLPFRGETLAISAVLLSAPGKNGSGRPAAGRASSVPTLPAFVAVFASRKAPAPLCTSGSLATCAPCRGQLHHKRHRTVYSISSLMGHGMAGSSPSARRPRARDVGVWG